MNEITPIQAVNILAQATEPGVRLSRSDFVAIDRALVVLRDAVSPKEAARAEVK